MPLVVEDSFEATLVVEVPGFEGYFVSRDGKVFSTRSAGKNRKPRNAWLGQRADPRTGALRVNLYRDGKSKTVAVHRIVAWAWIGPQSPGSKVCHADGVFENNEASNLYFGSERDNSLDREYHAREGRGSRRPGALESRDDRGFVYVPDPRFGF